MLLLFNNQLLQHYDGVMMKRGLILVITQQRVSQKSKGSSSQNQYQKYTNKAQMLIKYFLGHPLYLLRSLVTLIKTQ